MNYTELKQAVKDTLENEFSNTVLDMLTKQAEQKIYNSVQVASLRRNQTATLSANNKYFGTPVSFAVG